MAEYQKFVHWTEEQKVLRVCEELLNDDRPPDKVVNRWFRCSIDGSVWKLSAPDPGYFPGSWLPVKGEP